jgi:phospholipid/cholesterol/gamma-HCH transport system substrate-binding protein
MENKSHAYAAGTFVLALLALLIGLAFWLTKDNTQQRVFELSSREAVTGLQPQASVRFKGVNVGKVTAIGFARHRHAFPCAPA